MSAKTKRAKAVSSDNKQQERLKRSLTKQVLETFEGMGFVHFKSEHKQFKLGGRSIELDHLFVFQNVIIMCEETVGASDEHDHMRTKNESMRIITEHKIEFLQWAKGAVDGFESAIKGVSEARLKWFYIHVSGVRESYKDDEKVEFSAIKLWSKPDIDYFRWAAACLHKSARYDLFAYLGLKKCDIGPAQSAGHSSEIKSTIVYPANFIGPSQQYRVVTFMMAAGEMLEMSYVLRKDGWRTGEGLYQRLIDKKKMYNIRKYITKNQTSFFNNIIVALPQNARIEDGGGQRFSLFEREVSPNETGLALTMPIEYNSICLIDGQHRVYSYHEGGENDDVVELLRKERHLLVTGVQFPSTMSDEERLKLQSSIFLDINSTAKPIAPDLLIHIQKLKDPLADTSIAHDVIMALNANGVFKDAFQKTALKASGIKTASIVKFALKYLVAVKEQSNLQSLVHYWTGDYQKLMSSDAQARREYVSFCVEHIGKFFSAIKAAFGEDWGAKGSLLPSVVTINGFLIAYRRQLEVNGIKDIAFFRGKLKKWNKGFSRSDFPYRSSNYGRFASDILETVFEIKEA